MGHEIDRETLDKIRGLDEKTMQDIIKKLAQASGLNEQAASRLAGNSGFIRKKLASMNAGDVNKLIASADESTVSDILKTVRSENGRSGR